ncbi:unnamed protein product [Spodoptera littoralis]|uniref:Gustatory receptor n=1 Tax=Spodoptera littoralis TaxID=7109 RepID=A0A9P0I6Y3_SPOLI|nr:unnamed protein product [Spodoptera littoralis]CAH1640535.1 unnamed protein product [Spodoptera littoralis]
MFIALDVSIVVSMRFIILLRKYVEEWIKQALMVNYGRQDGERCNKLFRIYKNILKAYVLYKKIFHVLVFYHSFGVFYRNLVYFHIILSATVYNILSVCLWQMKNMCLIILQCILCEKFYISVEEVDSACIQLLKDKTCSNYQTGFYKKVLQTNRTFSKMTACGLFYIDAMLPIRMLLLTTNYVIVLLQFAFT